MVFIFELSLSHRNMPLFKYLPHSHCLFKTCPVHYTLLLFRKEIIKFSEVALVSAHLNCLISSIVIARGCRPCITASTTSYICLLDENGSKNTEIKCKVCSNSFFFRYLVALRSTLDQWHGGSLTHPVLTKTLSSTTRRWPGAL